MDLISTGNTIVTVKKKRIEPYIIVIIIIITAALQSGCTASKSLSMNQKSKKNFSNAKDSLHGFSSRHSPKQRRTERNPARITGTADNGLPITPKTVFRDRVTFRKIVKSRGVVASRVTLLSSEQLARNHEFVQKLRGPRNSEALSTPGRQNTAGHNQ